MIITDGEPCLAALLHHCKHIIPRQDGRVRVDAEAFDRILSVQKCNNLLHLGMHERLTAKEAQLVHLVIDSEKTGDLFLKRRKSEVLRFFIVLHEV